MTVERMSTCLNIIIFELCSNTITQKTGKMLRRFSLFELAFLFIIKKMLKTEVCIIFIQFWQSNLSESFRRFLLLLRVNSISRPLSPNRSLASKRLTELPREKRMINRFNSKRGALGPEMKYERGPWMGIKIAPEENVGQRSVQFLWNCYSSRRNSREAMMVLEDIQINQKWLPVYGWNIAHDKLIGMRFQRLSS